MEEEVLREIWDRMERVVEEWLMVDSSLIEREKGDVNKDELIGVWSAVLEEEVEEEGSEVEREEEELESGEIFGVISVVNVEIEGISVVSDAERRGVVKDEEEEEGGIDIGHLCLLLATLNLLLCFICSSLSERGGSRARLCWYLIMKRKLSLWYGCWQLSQHFCSSFSIEEGGGSVDVKVVVVVSTGVGVIDSSEDI